LDSWYQRKGAEYYKEYRKKNRARIREIMTKWRESNRETARLATKSWLEKNPEYHSDWANTNRGKRNAYEAKRRAAKLQATPRWLTLEQLQEIEQFYINCPKGFHVDHIHPLQGDGFSGLHVPWNLQYLPALENFRKNNKLEVV